MSRTTFWVAFPSALFLGVFLAVSMPHEPVPLLLVALVWVGTLALALNRWVARDLSWLWRVAAVITVSIIVLSVFEWLSADGAFVTSSKCDKRPGTFWPLFFYWLAGGGLFSYALFGKLSQIQLITKPAIRAVVWWISILAWTAVCGYVFANNITMEVFIESMRVAGLLVGGIALFFGGIFAFAWVSSIPERRRQKEASAAYESMDEASRQEVIDLIDSHSREREYMLMYRSVEHDGGVITGARIGGDPAALPDEIWPTNDDGSSAIFLLQLPLVAPRFPPIWQERIISVFLVEYSLVVRSYGSSVIPQLVAFSNPKGESEVIKQELQALAIPYAPTSEDGEDEEEFGGFDAGQLLTQIPALKAGLEARSKYPIYLLNKLIEGKAQLSSEDAILVGGDPQLIQGEHDPLCPVCQKPMRFLFQFGDVTEEFEMGDCGVGYVYGCDVHPEHCLGFVDCS